MDSEDNVLELGGVGSESALLDSLISDYQHCNERRRCAIRCFAHKLSEMESPHLSAKILPFQPK